MLRPEFNPETPLYIRDDHSWEAGGLANYEALMDRLLASGAPPLLFVHGRGLEPQKSVVGRSDRFGGGEALRKLRQGHGVQPLLFNWDSFGTGLDRERPMADTQRAAEQLGQLLKVHEHWLASRPATPKPVLLVHSMGAIVLEKLVSRVGWPAGSRLFTRVVFSQPDANAQDHEVWLSQLARMESVWVTWNSADPVLRVATSGRQPGERALGRGVDASAALAPGVSYLDLSGMSASGAGVLAHPVFEVGQFPGQPHVDNLMGRLLRGEPVNPNAVDPDIEQRDARGVIYVRRQR